MPDVTFDHVIRTRRTTRAYRPDPVPEALLQELVDLAILAPTAMGAQPWRFSIVTNRKVLREVNGQVKQLLLEAGRPEFARYRAMFENPDFDIFWGAPAVIVIQGPAGSQVAAIDCVLAAENLILAAHARGLGNCYMGFLMVASSREDIARAVGVAPGYQMVAPIAVGYSDAIPAAPPERTPADITWVR